MLSAIISHVTAIIIYELEAVAVKSDRQIQQIEEILQWVMVGQSHTRHLYRKNTLVMSFREAQRREIFGYKASLDPTEKISRSYRRSK